MPRDAGSGKLGSVSGIGSERARVVEKVKKSAIRKTMRVATTFTGAAAVAATFTPVANAATHPAMHGRYHKLPIAEGHGTGATPHTTIHSGPCSVHPTWLHIEWATYTHQSQPFLTCLGFAGTLTLDQALSMRSQCGGNNHGRFNVGGQSLTFRAGTTYRQFFPGYNVFNVHISGWAGSDTCPL